MFQSTCLLRKHINFVKENKRRRVAREGRRGDGGGGVGEIVTDFLNGNRFIFD